MTLVDIKAAAIDVGCGEDEDIIKIMRLPYWYCGCGWLRASAGCGYHQSHSYNKSQTKGKI